MAAKDLSPDLYERLVKRSALMQETIPVTVLSRERCMRSGIFTASSTENPFRELSEVRLKELQRFL